MKKIICYILLVCLPGVFASCGDDNEPGDPSIFPTNPPVRNEFDQWLLENYTIPYNVDFRYKMDDIESMLTYTLAPADLDKSIALAKLVKFMWFEAYEEVTGRDFVKAHAPRMIHLVGSGAYNPEGTMVLGAAEGGLKVTLLMANVLDPDNLNIATLNKYFFKTMHHEFGHILHQTIEFDPSFEFISEASYVSGNFSSKTDKEANALGFVSAYAMSEVHEDFVETLAVYVINTQEAWDKLLTTAGKKGAPIITRKLDMVKQYMQDAWGIDLVQLRDVVQRRATEIYQLDLKTLK